MEPTTPQGNVVKRTYLVTDRVALDKGKLVINPMPMSVGGRMEYLGDAVLPVKDCLTEYDDDGSKVSYAVCRQLSRRDGVVEVTKELVEKMIEIGIQKGWVEV